MTVHGVAKESDTLDLTHTHTHTHTHLLEYSLLLILAVVTPASLSAALHTYKLIVIKFKPFAWSLSACRLQWLPFCFITQYSCPALCAHRTTTLLLLLASANLSSTVTLCSGRFLCLESSSSMEVGCFSCLRIQLKWPLLGEVLPDQSPLLCNSGAYQSIC